jgi:hypothetical protein
MEKMNVAAPPGNPVVQQAYPAQAYPQQAYPQQAYPQQQAAPYPQQMYAQQPQQQAYTQSEGYCCSLVLHILCFQVQLYPHVKVSPPVCCAKKMEALAFCWCCQNCDRFGGRGLLTRQDFLDNLELHEAVFAQSCMSRTFPICCLSTEQNKKFFSIVESKNLNVYPYVCCYQVFGYTYFQN